MKLLKYSLLLIQIPMNLKASVTLDTFQPYQLEACEAMHEQFTIPPYEVLHKQIQCEIMPPKPKVGIDDKFLERNLLEAVYYAIFTRREEFLKLVKLQEKEQCHPYLEWMREKGYDKRFSSSSPSMYYTYSMVGIPQIRIAEKQKAVAAFFYLAAVRMTKSQFRIYDETAILSSARDMAIEFNILAPENHWRIAYRIALLQHSCDMISEKVKTKLGLLGIPPRRSDSS